MSNGGGGDDGGGSCWARPTKVNLAPRRRIPSWDSASLLSSSRDRSMKATKDGEDSIIAMMAVSVAATENDDMASTTHVNTSANESPRDEQNFEKRCV